MLALTRQTNERIQIGDDIVTEVREVRGTHIKIGISESSSQRPCGRIWLHCVCRQEDMTVTGLVSRRAVCCLPLRAQQGGRALWGGQRAGCRPNPRDRSLQAAPAKPPRAA